MKKKNFAADPTKMFITSETLASDPEDQKKDPGIPGGMRLVPELKSERTNLLLRPSLKKGLKAAADARGTSLNDLINDIISDYLKEK